MSVFERIECEIAFFANGVIAAVIRHQRVRKLMQTKGKNPTDQDDGKGHVCFSSYSLGWDRCHCQALERISSMLSCSGSQPSSRFIFSEDATRRAESPGRRGSSCTGMGCPVTRRAVSITWRTE